MAALGEKRKKRKGTASCEPCCNYDWECEEDLRSLARAKAVESDPARMEKVKKLAASKLDEYERRREEAQAMVDLGNGKNI